MAIIIWWHCVEYKGSQVAEVYRRMKKTQYVYDMTWRNKKFLTSIFETNAWDEVFSRDLSTLSLPLSSHHHCILLLHSIRFRTLAPCSLLARLKNERGSEGKASIISSLENKNTYVFFTILFQVPSHIRSSCSFNKTGIDFFGMKEYIKSMLLFSLSSKFTK